MTCKEQILSNEYYDYITNITMEEAGSVDSAFCYQQIDNLFTIAYLNRDIYPDIDNQFFPYQSIPKLFGLMNLSNNSMLYASQTNGPTGYFDPLSLSASGIMSVSGAPLNLTGAGVLIAIIDTGINFASPVFLDANGRSKILAIWDQTIESGNPPRNFFYGTEYTNAQINEALQAENPYEIIPSKDDYNHGNILAALAAGSEITSAMDTGAAVNRATGNFQRRDNMPVGYMGVAKDASLIIVKCKEAKQNLKNYYLVPNDAICYQENDLMLAVQYCNRFAEQNNMPLVICLGMGTNMGDHSGNIFLSGYLNYIAYLRNRAVVVCGGNEGNAGHHYQGSTRNEPQSVEIRVDNNVNGFTMEFWGELPDIYTMAIRSPGGENIAPVSLSATQSIQFRFVFEPTTVMINTGLVESSSGKQLIRVRMEKPTPGIWNFIIGNAGPVENGIFHMYLPISQHLSAPVYFLTPSPDITLTEPSLAQDVFSVTAYNPANQSIGIFSGRGYAANGLIRPDLAAPGVDVSTINGLQTGSGVAAAITAGAIAQFLQWATVEGNRPALRGREIKSYFIRGAKHQTGLDYPNRQWGYGQLNVQGVFERLRG